MTIKEFAEHTGLSYSAIHLSIKNGMPNEPAKPITIDPEVAIAWRKEHPRGRPRKSVAA